MQRVKESEAGEVAAGGEEGRTDGETVCSGGGSSGSSYDDGSRIADSASRATSLEAEHVTRVYNQIAKHFSDTRHSGWPRVCHFLRSLPAGSVVYDVGCGNGKYWGVNPLISLTGVDSSLELLRIARARGLAVLLASATDLPFRSSSADNVISIAVLHHLSTPDGRLRVLQEISRVLKPRASALVTVWAFEQNRSGSSSKYISKKSSKADSLVAARDVTQAAAAAAAGAAQTDLSLPDPSFLRNTAAEGLPIHRNRTPFTSQDVLVPWTCKRSGERLFRYYHVFVEGELPRLCSQVPGIAITDHYYDEGNWCVVIEKREAAAAGEEDTQREGEEEKSKPITYADR